MNWNFLPQPNIQVALGKYLNLKQALISNSARIRVIIQQIIVAILAGFLFSFLHIPVGWLLGPMVAGIVYAIIQPSSQPLPTIFMTTGKAFLGIATAIRFLPETLTAIAAYAIPLLLCVIITGGISLFHGYLFSRWADIDRTTGLLSFIPGMASSIVAIGEDIGADAVSIALFQYIRLLLVVFIIPSIANTMLPVESAFTPLENFNFSIHVTTPDLGVLNIIVILLCCTLGTWVGKALRIPASGYLGPFMLGLLLFWLSPYPIDVPPWIFTTGLFCVGLSIGIKFNWQAARHLWKAVVIEVGLVAVLSFLCLGIGYGFHLITHVDTVTAVLGFTPGGIEAMIATVIQLGGNPGLVLAMQLTRMLLILLLGPWLIDVIVRTGKPQET